MVIILHYRYICKLFIMCVILFLMIFIRPRGYYTDSQQNCFCFSNDSLPYQWRTSLAKYQWILIESCELTIGNTSSCSLTGYYSATKVVFPLLRQKVNNRHLCYSHLLIVFNLLFGFQQSCNFMTSIVPTCFSNIQSFVSVNKRERCIIFLLKFSLLKRLLT